MKWTPDKKFTTPFYVIGGLVAGSFTVALGYAGFKNDISALRERQAALEIRQAGIEAKITELRDLSIEQKTILKGIFDLSNYSADGRKGPKPEVTRP